MLYLSIVTYFLCLNIIDFTMIIDNGFKNIGIDIKLFISWSGGGGLDLRLKDEAVKAICESRLKAWRPSDWTVLLDISKVSSCFYQNLLPDQA